VYGIINFIIEGTNLSQSFILSPYIIAYIDLIVVQSGFSFSRLRISKIGIPSHPIFYGTPT
jgi:hypothetical protein